MGVPAFFRWLSRKYPSIVVHCVEEKRKEINGVQVPVDTSQPNPNDVEFDNLYLDMNGIIHPCCHPEDKPEPKNEDEMMVLIFQYIDRIFSVCRPRRLLYMAIDGVAPRAKMNQQRSRRFRASKESAEKAKLMTEMREEMMSKGAYLPPVKPATERFDSNCITPGTPFMFRLADCLRYYIHDRLNNDPGWKDIKVVLSDANVPGEGEHKIMDYIRKQRAQPDHDPGTKHCLCGADADLIMLGLATHETNFTIIREEFKPNQPRPCELCGQMGHEMKNCEGLPKEMSGEHDELSKVMGAECEFIFIRLNVLREYLERELLMDNLPFTYDFERALDDWVFMCFFVGNDFLPHLPSLEIREGAIDRLVKLYKNAVYQTGGYLTDSGVVSLERVQLVMSQLGEVEDEIFKKRRNDEVRFKQRMKDRKQRERRQQQFASQRGLMAAVPIGQGGGKSQNLRHQAYEMRKQHMSTSSTNQANTNVASELKQLMQKTGDKKDDDSDEEPPDDVRLWEDGWKDRYYSQKFDVDADDIAFRHTVANHYVRGLCWVLRYYYQGCASWKWYFPYHYAPFASDFVNIGELPNDFEKNTKPFQPMEQLMSVFPAASKKHLPPSWQPLMYEPESPIIDFYPTNFKIDLNGKRYAWQGVALLPFVDEVRLHKTLQAVYPDLTDAERKRNILGADRLFLSSSNPGYSFFEGLYEGGGPQTKDEAIQIQTEHTQGMGGIVWCDSYRVETGGKPALVVQWHRHPPQDWEELKTLEFVFFQLLHHDAWHYEEQWKDWVAWCQFATTRMVMSPLDSCPDLTDNKTICLQYHDPLFDANFLFPARLLPGAKLADRVLKPGDFEQNNHNQHYRPQLGFQRNSGYRGRGTSDVSSAVRMIQNTTGMRGQGFVMSSQSMMPSYTGFVPALGASGGGQQQYGGRQGAQQWSNSSNNTAWNRNMSRQQDSYNTNQNRYQQQQQQSVHRPFPGTSSSSYDSYQSSRSYGGGGGGREGRGREGGGGGGYGYGSSDRNYGGPDRNYGGSQQGGRPPLRGGYGDNRGDRRYQGREDNYQRADDRRTNRGGGYHGHQERFRPY